MTHRRPAASCATPRRRVEVAAAQDARQDAEVAQHAPQRLGARGGNSGNARQALVAGA
jgi:hypothetical protein